ncbi:hypothetical protein PM8797T_28074 [Gimesia maris DSM 8797]|nr:hypothetical protein PM8797T_28074 [Gimesia maris DSM 8797]
MIAKIANGQQEAGKEILSRIAAITSVNQKWLETGFGEPLLFQPSEERFLIPISNALLPGLPSRHKALHTTQNLALPASIYQPTRYAIEAINCFQGEPMPAVILPQDLLIIETAITHWRSNLQVLEQKYAVILTHSAAGKLLKLELLTVKHKADELPLIYSVGNENPDQNLQDKNEKLRRRIELENRPSHQSKSRNQNQTENSYSEDLLIPIDVKQIAGTVIQLIRNY